ncbi:hypothetical protein INR49_028827 [Caranx melampygus]|nr:hypothetical protein INR49_028827 [Caranx melampygus]
MKTIKEDDQREHNWLELNFDLDVLHLIDKGDLEECAKVAHAVAFELVPLNGDKDLVVHQILDGSAAGCLLVSAQLATELPLPARGGCRIAICARVFR